VRLTSTGGAVGLPLARDLPTTAGGLPLLARGAIVSERFRRALEDQGIRAVWVEDELSAGIVPPELLSEADRADAETRVRAALSSARGAVASSRPLPAATVADLEALARTLVARARAPAGTTVALDDLAPAGRYLHRHPVNSAALGLLVARALFQRHGWADYRGTRQFDRIDERLALLGLALLLKDIGNAAVPADVLHKPGPLDDRERAMVRRHVDAGVELVSSRSISPRVVEVVADHHERHDGSGYPHGRVAAELHQFVAIAAVADVYAAATSERPHRRAAPAHAGVVLIADGRGTAFDPEVADVFRAVVAPHPPGVEIALAHGRVGVVARVDRYQPHLLTVRLPGAGGPVEERVDARTWRTL
jgi:HD-GYP domain-containing protein (c-di-GMP phosphodiesterase class II)